MSERTRCFLIERTGLERKVAYAWCPEDHKTQVIIGTPALEWDMVPWPETCPDCGLAMGDDDGGYRSIHHQRDWIRRDTAETRWEVRDFGPGAMWNADWMTARHPDGRYLVVMLPNGHEWAIDSQASNCTRKGEPHQCWVRHGEPPDITVDKEGDTCAAGGGSIWSAQGLPGDWHGHLRAGWLERC